MRSCASCVACVSCAALGLRGRRLPNDLNSAYAAKLTITMKTTISTKVNPRLAG